MRLSRPRWISTSARTPSAHSLAALIPSRTARKASTGASHQSAIHRRRRLRARLVSAAIGGIGGAQEVLVLTRVSMGRLGSIVPPSVQYYQLMEKAPQVPEAAALRFASELYLSFFFSKYEVHAGPADSPMRVPVPVLPDPINMNGTFEQIAAQPFVPLPPPPPPPPQSDTLDTASSHRRSGRPPTYCTMPRQSKR